MSSVYISYRRTDTSGDAEKLYARLVDRFGALDVFKDVASTERGARAVEVIENTLSRCDALLAVIGLDWLPPIQGTGRWSDDQEDWVRLEIANALQHGVPVVAVLVQGASMPSAEDLPDDLHGLARCDGVVELGEAGAAERLDQLLQTLDNGLRGLPLPGPERQAELRTLKIKTGRREGRVMSMWQLVLRVTAWDASVELGDSPSVRLTVDPASIDVESGSGGQERLSDADKADIRRFIRKVLGRTRITFRASDVQVDRRALTITGDLTIAGCTRRVTVPLVVAADGSASGGVALSHSSFGIKPFSMLRVWRADDRFEVLVEAQLTAVPAARAASERAATDSRPEAHRAEGVPVGVRHIDNWPKRVHRRLPTAVNALAFMASLAAATAAVGLLDAGRALKVEHTAQQVVADVAGTPNALSAETMAFDAYVRAQAATRLQAPGGEHAALVARRRINSAEQRLTGRLNRIKHQLQVGNRRAEDFDATASEFFVAELNLSEDVFEGIVAQAVTSSSRSGLARSARANRLAATDVGAQLEALGRTMSRVAGRAGAERRRQMRRAVTLSGLTVLLAALILTLKGVLRRHPAPASPTYARLMAEGTFDVSTWSWLGGWWMRIAGSGLLTTACLSWLLMYTIFKSESIDLGIGARAAVVLGGILAFVVLSILGSLLWDAGKRRLAAQAAFAAARTQRAPVLYLRSFRDDVRARSEAPNSFREDLLVSPALPPPVRSFSEEEHLAMAMRRIGPFIALGEPGEGTPQPGASRFYLTVTEWRPVVAELMSAARLVLLRIGATDGLWWEIEYALTTLSPTRVAILLPPDEQDYAEFRVRTATLFAQPLPPYPPGGFRGLPRGLLHFERDWTPRIVSFAEQGRFSQGTPRWLTGIFLSGMRPVAKQLGISRLRLLRWPETVLHAVMTLVGLGLVATIIDKVVNLVTT